LLERLAKKPVTRTELEENHRGSPRWAHLPLHGYIKYHEAVRDVILADSKRYLVTNQ